MIKLTFQNGSKSTQHSYDQEVVTIGYGPSDQVSLVLPDSSLQKEHVKIVKELERYLVFNCANDPFVALNGLPFAKQTIVNGDRIEIGRLKIFFEVMEKKVQTQDENEEVLIEEPAKEPVPLLKKEVKKKKVRIVEAEEPQEALASKPAPPPSPTIEPLSPEKRWSMLLKMVIPALLFFLFLGAFTYIQFSGQSQEQENTAAKGLADIGMSLTYAQVVHLTPVQQHWASPTFLEEMFSQVIGKEFDLIAQIDATGNFTNSDYFLRIYTSYDSAQFIAIAQPNPSLMQWLIPKSAIIIDSATMKMHRVPDLRALNRILVNAQTIDPLTAKKIASILDKTEPISIFELAEAGKENGFSPPTSIDSALPGAEYLIYNAPRYYPFGERILQQVIEQQSDTKKSFVITKEMEAMAHLPQIILYSSKGIEEARQAFDALQKHPFTNDMDAFPFHIAYLDLDSDGNVVSSHLLTDEQLDDEEHIAVIETRDPPVVEELNPDPEVTSSPVLFERLTALLNEREKTLSPVANKITQLLQQQVHDSVPNFTAQLQEFFDEFSHLNQEEQRKLTSGLSHLFQEYSTTPPQEFMQAIEEAGLQNFVNQILEEHPAKTE